MEILVMLRKCPEGLAGRYNGYVAFDKNCPWFKEDEISCEDFRDIQCNGGITFAWLMKKDSLDDFEIVDGDPDKLDEDILVIGFDTLHGWDRDWMWPKERVAIEAERIRQQVCELTPGCHD